MPRQRILLHPMSLFETGPIAAFLGRDVFEVSRVSGDAADVLLKACALQPDLLVFGSDLKGMSPAEFCSAARQAPELKDLQLLLLTEQIGDDVLECSEADADAHLLAPVSDEQLIATVSELLEARVRAAVRLEMEILASTSGLALDTNGLDNVVVMILNLSERGVRVESPQYLRLGAQGTIRFKLPRSNRSLCLACRVRLLNDEFRLHYGLEFEDLEAESRKAIRCLVRGQEDGDEPDRD